MALEKGTIAVALINGQMTVVRGIRSHRKHDHLLDVELYKPLSRNVFIADSCSRARIYSTDLRAIFPDSDYARQLDRNMLELPRSAYQEFAELSSYNSRRMDNIWGQAVGKLRARMR